MADFGTFPIPVAIIAGDPANPQGVIEDFGEVVLQDGDDFSVESSFCDDNDGNGGTDDGNDTPVVSGDTNDVGGGAPTSGAVKLLATGGLLPIAAAVGALVLAGGLIAHRFGR